MEQIHNFYLTIFPMFVGKFEIFFYFLDTLTFITIMRIVMCFPDYVMGFRKRIY